jgi:hypothetical protein
VVSDVITIAFVPSVQVFAEEGMVADQEPEGPDVVAVTESLAPGAPYW